MVGLRNFLFIISSSLLSTTMASHQSSDISEALTNPSACLAPIFTKPTAPPNPPVSLAQHTRFAEKRHPVVPPKAKKSKQVTPATHSPLETPSISTPDESVEPSEDGMLLDEEGERPQSEAFLPLPIPGPELSVSQAHLPQRDRISWIHEHCYAKRKDYKDYWQCNHCSKAYQKSGGTRVITGHLRTKHRLDQPASSVARKREANGTAVHAALLRHGQITSEGKEQLQALRRDEILAQRLDKATLEFLYLQWTITSNVSFNQVKHEHFQAFLEFLNPAANQLLPRSSDTMTIHATTLHAEGKQRLRHILASALSDIHITCDMWSSPNHLGLLAVVAHFTDEHLKLQTVTLGLIEINGKHSSSNQATAVLKMLDDFCIRSKLGYFIMDNIGSNNNLVQEVANVLQADGIQYNA